jgi:hypothetical protein
VDEIVAYQPYIAEVVDQHVAFADRLVGLLIEEIRDSGAELLFPQAEEVGEPLRIGDCLRLG